MANVVLLYLCTYSCKSLRVSKCKTRTMGLKEGWTLPSMMVETCLEDKAVADGAPRRTGIADAAGPGS